MFHLSAFSADSSAEAAQRIGGYLDNLASGSSARQGGAGIQSYLSTVGSNSAIQGSASAVKVTFGFASFSFSTFVEDNNSKIPFLGLFFAQIVLS